MYKTNSFKTIILLLTFQHFHLNISCLVFDKYYIYCSQTSKSSKHKTNKLFSIYLDIYLATIQ